MSRKSKVYYIFMLDYSQTDRSTVIVNADSREQAEKWLRRHGERGPRYVTYCGSSNIIRAKDVA